MSIPDPEKLEWWKKTTVYQIYPRSFKDSTGNGIGDLQGIISKLDYLKNLGIETIWFSPFFNSPQGDFGYDISGYRTVAPEYGALDDVKQLIEEIHKRGMKIVLDMVMNHTSDQHPWFIESRSSKDNPKRDWYVWANPKPGTGKDGKKPKPPNNWTAMIGGSSWNYDEKTKQYYYSMFLPFQPDLNYRNPEVKEEMFNTVRFWLDLGADGFRLDIINSIYEDPQLRNNPKSPIPMLSNKYTLDHPDTMEFAKELRAVIDEYDEPERFLVGEVTGDLDTIKTYCGDIDDKKCNGLHSIFLFKTLNASLKAGKFKKLISEFEKRFQPPLIPVWVFSNHDRMRRISRMGDNLEKGKLLAAFQLTVRGVPYIYYGEEIGLPQGKLNVKDALDPVALKYSWVPNGVFSIAKKTIGETVNRDECRTPMQWDDSPTAGFSPKDVKPWLPVSSNFHKINVLVKEQEEDSILHCYKRFLLARKEYPALHSGSIKLMDDKSLPNNVLAYMRKAQFGKSEQKLYVYLNFSNKPQTISIPRLKPMLICSTTLTSKAVQNDRLDLGPLEGIVVQW